MRRLSLDDGCIVDGPYLLPCGGKKKYVEDGMIRE